MNTFKIRKADNLDADDIVKMISDCVIKTHSELYPPDDLNETLNNYTFEKVQNHIDVNTYFIAVENEEIVGCVLTVENNMKSLYVNPEHMRKGIGKALVLEAEEHVKSEGYDEIKLWSSLIAQEFYQKLGYEDVKDVPNRDGLVLHFDMRKDLS